MTIENKPRTRGFVKGKSGNPGGRPKDAFSFAEFSRKYMAKEGQKKLVEWANSKNPKASMTALTLLANYAFGKPTEHHEHSGSVSIEQLLGDSRV